MLIDIFLTYIVLLILNAFLIVGIHRAGAYEMTEWGDVIKEQDMIFGFVHRYLRRTIGIFWTKPIIGCPTCMASVHSIYTYWPMMIAIFGWHPELIYGYLLYIPILSGLATYVSHKCEY